MFLALSPNSCRPAGGIEGVRGGGGALGGGFKPPTPSSWQGLFGPAAERATVPDLPPLPRGLFGHRYCLKVLHQEFSQAMLEDNNFQGVSDANKSLSNQNCGNWMGG